MNPRALAAWSLSGITIALATGNPVYRLLVLLCAINLLTVFRRADVAAESLQLDAEPLGEG